MTDKPRLTAILIVKNEEKDVRDCLESLQPVASEIIVLDSGSTDRTKLFCREFTSQVYDQAWLGYGAQKQAALEKATGNWILNLDADERLSPLLAEEIKRTLEKPAADAYRIPFHHYFLGRRLRFGGAMGETHIRLFKKGHGSYGGAKVHEGISIQGKVGKLTHPILHFSYRTIEDYLGKCNEYTSLIAEKKAKKGVRFWWGHHLRLPFEFLVRYFVKLGFLDGQNGLTYALLSSYYAWLKFLKIRDFQEENNESN